VRLSLVIATYQRVEPLRETLESLRACDPLPDEVLVVDGDEARSAEPAVAEHVAAGDRPPARYVPSPRGLTRQRNVGVRAAEGDVLVFADDDVDFEPGIFGVLARAFEDRSVVGATARVIEPDPRSVGGASSRLRSLLPGGGEEGTMTRFGYPRRIVDVHTPRDIEFLHGCLMAARRDDALAIGFDETMAGNYTLAEDEDFGYRLSRRGRVRYLPDAVVHHKVLGKSSRVGTRAFNRVLVRNRAHMFRKSFRRTPAARAQFVLMIGLLVVHRLLNREWQGAAGLLEGAALAWRERS
jgi:GT2 family glycosyltransferase